MRNTRQRLLETATQMFAEYGFDGVSTRDLVCMSGVNLCTVNYYFGSKQKLYNAVIADIVAQVRRTFVDKIDEYVAAHKMSPREHLVFALGEFFDFLFSDNLSNAMALIAMREFLMPATDCVSGIYKDILNPLKERASRLIMDAANVDAQTAYILAHSLFAQVISLRLHQNAHRYSADFLGVARRQILENCEILLEGRGKCSKK